jgi:hypothetical protein
MIPGVGRMPRDAVLGILTFALLASAGCGGEARDSDPRTPATTRAESVVATTASGPGSTLADLARVSCDGETTRVLTPRVRPQRDGIHVRFENDAGHPLSYSIKAARGDGSGADVPLNGVDAVVALPPGELTIACFDPRSPADPSDEEGARIEAVDAREIWTPTLLSSTCETAVSTIADYPVGAAGERGSTEEVARRFLEKQDVLEAGDVVEKAGYPEQEQQVVRLVRDGETLAVLDFLSDGDGGWLLSTTNACSGIRLG